MHRAWRFVSRQPGVHASAIATLVLLEQWRPSEEIGQLAGRQHDLGFLAELTIDGVWPQVPSVFYAAVIAGWVCHPRRPGMAAIHAALHAACKRWPALVTLAVAVTLLRWVWGVIGWLFTPADDPVNLGGRLGGTVETRYLLAAAVEVLILAGLAPTLALIVIDGSSLGPAIVRGWQLTRGLRGRLVAALSIFAVAQWQWIWRAPEVLNVVAGWTGGWEPWLLILTLVAAVILHAQCLLLAFVARALGVGGSAQPSGGSTARLSGSRSLLASLPSGWRGEAGPVSLWRDGAVRSLSAWVRDPLGTPLVLVPAALVLAWAPGGRPLLSPRPLQVFAGALAFGLAQACLTSYIASSGGRNWLRCGWQSARLHAGEIAWAAAAVTVVCSLLPCVVSQVDSGSLIRFLPVGLGAIATYAGWFALPCVVLEGATMPLALGRSWELGRGHRIELAALTALVWAGPVALRLDPGLLLRWRAEWPSPSLVGLLLALLLLATLVALAQIHGYLALVRLPPPTEAE